MMSAPFMFHMFVNALFYGFLALAVGAWTRQAASLAGGVRRRVMVLSFFAVGLLPLIEGWESAAKAFPWYYYDAATRCSTAVDWGHMAVLLGGIVLFAVAAARRCQPARPQEQAGRRQPGRPAAQQPADREDRATGSPAATRVSKIWVKTASEHQGLLFVTASSMFFMMGVLIGPMYTLIDDALKNASPTSSPRFCSPSFGGGDMGTPEGFYQVETFGMMAPIAVMVVTVAIGARAAGRRGSQQHHGSAAGQPGQALHRRAPEDDCDGALRVCGRIRHLRRSRRWVAARRARHGHGQHRRHLAAGDPARAGVRGACRWPSSAGTGETRVAVYGTVGAALGVPHPQRIRSRSATAWPGCAKWSPFYYYLGSDPLNNGMHWGHAAVLTGLTVLLIGWLWCCSNAVTFARPADVTAS